MASSLRFATSNAHLKWVQVLAFVILLLSIAIPRSLELDRFATFDEHLWVTRAANFYCALSHHDLANTFQREHPGVTTMWAGTLGFLWRANSYKDDCEQVGKREHEQTLRDRGFDPVELLEGGRLFLVLGNTVVLVLGFIYARRLVGFWPAWAGFMLIALDPFHVAHSRLLHVDGSASSLMLLAILSWLGYLRGRRIVDLVVSGIAAGLGWLTKSSTLFLIPFTGLLVLIHGWRTLERARLASTLWHMAWPLMLWGIVGVVTFVLLWPAMWTDPVGTFSKVLELAEDYSTRGHPNPVFFNGVLYEDGRLDASFIHFYPLTYLWRSTPATLLGLLAAAVTLILRRGPFTGRAAYSFALVLMAFALLFGLAMNLSAKKFDRYFLPAYAPLDLVAGMGWVAVAQLVAGLRRLSLRQYVSTLVVLGAIVIQAVPIFQTYPYYLTYYNPLVGGSRTAPQILLIGWGEGLDQAARYLNQKPGAEQFYVLSWYVPGCFSYFFDGTSRDLPYSGWEDIHFQEALNSDYAVVYYAHELQRYAPKQLLDYLAHQTPEHAVWIDGLEYVRIYKMRADLLSNPAYRPVDATLGGQILLEGYALSQHRLVPGESIVVSLSWQAVEKPAEKLKIFVQLLNQDGILVAQHDGEPVAWISHTDEWQPGQQITDHHGVTLPPDLPPGEYTLIVGMYRPSGERLAIEQRGQPVGDALFLEQVIVHPSEPEQ